MGPRGNSDGPNHKKKKGFNAQFPPDRTKPVAAKCANPEGKAGNLKLQEKGPTVQSLVECM